VDGAGLVLGKDIFIQLFILLGEEDKMLEEIENMLPVAEGLDLILQLPNPVGFPIKDIPADHIPGYPVGEPDSFGGGEDHLRDE
jgi:hypothetical protein